MKKILTIAGSDCSGGAGIQADIKTITVHGMYAMSVITALTAQNTRGVSGVSETSAEFAEQQMESVFSDIVPDAVKIGMLPGRKMIEAIAGKLEEYQAENIVLDPVMVSTSGSPLVKEGAAAAMISHLMPMVRIVTPNLSEAEVLSGTSYRIRTKADMEAAAGRIAERLTAASEASGRKGRCPAILLKGGHLTGSADDLLYLPEDQGRMVWMPAERVENPNTHGTGCTLSSAIACGLAENPEDLETAVRNAKKFVRGAIASGLDLGTGNGPLNHMYQLRFYAV